LRSSLRRVTCLLAIVLLAAFAGASGLPARSGPRTARAVCGDNPETPDALFVFDPPGSDFQVAGPAPLRVTVTMTFGLTVPVGATGSLTWGDGSPATPFTGQDCGDGIAAYWPQQAKTHTYQAAGQYTVTWSFSSIIGNFNIPIAMVNVQGAQQPTPAPPSPTAAPATAVPTAIPPPTAAPATVPATAAAPLPTVSAVAAAPSPTASPTSAPTSTPTPGPAPATPTPAPEIRSVAEPPPRAVEREADLPEALRALPTLGEISTDAGTVATNLALAGATVWVLFSSVLLNQVLQDNRGEIDRKTAGLTRPLRKLGAMTTGAGSPRALGRWLAPAGVLTLTGLIYGFLDPNFGLNSSSLLLFLSVVIGVGLVTYVCSGVEALMTRRTFHLHAAVRPYPASLAVAVVSVVISRLLNLQPGVIYGFAASCAVSGTNAIDERRQGSVTIFPVMAALALSIVSLIAIEPLRASDAIAASWPGQLAIGAGIIIFVGGIEGVTFNMIPLAVMDGGKLYRWRRPVWAAILVVSAFLFWQILLNRDQQYFESLRTTSSLTILLLFLAYAGLSIGLWAYFRWRPARAQPGGD